MNTEKSIVNNLKAKSIQVKKLILDISHKAQVGHIGSALSIADILTVLYFTTLKVDPKNPKKINRDRFILSKGHAVPALWSILTLKHFFSYKRLFSYCQNKGFLGEHPEHTIPGVELTTGSLGHGLSVGVGFALAAKINKKKYKSYVLISDAECNEGEVWQAAASAAHHKLDNLIAIVDYNKVQALGTTKEVLDLEPFRDKWLAFGWNTIECDGHNIPSLYKIFRKDLKTQAKPTVVIAHTVRGKDVSYMEHKLEWHYLTVNQEQYKQAVKDLTEMS